MQFENVRVNKPWGYEYLLFENDNVAIWDLHINSGAETSLHSHPNKKTGLLVLSGTIQVDFLNGKHVLWPTEKIMIRQGVFHKSKVLGSQNGRILEIESPKNKDDIVRLKDKYGRAGKAYEDQEAYTPQTRTQSLSVYPEKYGKCTLSIQQFFCREELEAVRHNLYMIIAGNIYFNHHVVLGPGDIVNQNTINQLLEFEIDNLVAVVVD